MDFRMWLESRIPVYRGKSVYNRGGKYWTTDKEWALQFTQSGRPSEVESRWIDPQVILKLDPLPRATSEKEFDQAIEAARAGGYAAVWFDEGPGEPDSVYVIRRSALR